MLAPVCLFTYNRLTETRQTINALQLNLYASESNLIVFSDGGKDAASWLKVNAVRAYLKTIIGFKTIEIIESPVNKGLASSIIEGVSAVVEKHNKVIVLEDDLVTSKYFLDYMNKSLDYYESNKQVMQISAFMFPINPKDLPDTFFYQANTCWGWGTWKRAWSKLITDTNQIMEELNQNKISWKRFNSMQGRAFERQLNKNINGKIRTWAVKWHATIIINNGLVLHPKSSLVINIGLNGKGENCVKEDMNILLSNDANIDVASAINFSNELAIKKLKVYFDKRYSLIELLKRNVFNKIRIIE